MNTGERRGLNAAYGAALALATLAYLIDLGSWGIPSNGDEYVYAEIARSTAASGHWLPLASDLARNTKPPLLFWQGIVSTEHGRHWTLLRLRLPDAIDTLAIAAIVLVLTRRMTGAWHRGAIAALLYLGCYSVYRYGRPFLTDAPESLWLLLPLAWLLWSRGSALDRPLIFGAGSGIAVGVAALYKSFALIVPVALAMLGWYYERGRRRPAGAIAAAVPSTMLMAAIALGLFALWPLLDPDPAAIWRGFVVGENSAKFVASGYLTGLLWGGSSVPGLAGSLLLNSGLLAPLFAVVTIDAWSRRRALETAERQLWIWILAFFIAFALPSQRSGRYLLPVMPALAMLCALNWDRVPRAAFVACAALAAIVATVFAGVAVLMLRDTETHIVLPWYFWGVLALALACSFGALLHWRSAPAIAPVTPILILLLLGISLRSFDSPPDTFPAAARERLRGCTVFVPSSFAASEEGHRFLLPGADIRGYPEDDNLTPLVLSQRYRYFAAFVPIGSVAECPGCRALGERYVIRGRRASALLGDLQGARALRDFFQREVLFESPGAATPANSTTSE